MELVKQFDTSDQFEDEKTTDRGQTYPADQHRLIELQRLLADEPDLFALVDIMARMNGEERAVFRFLGDRHLVGRERYGELGLLDDTRDFAAERAQECGDLLMYSAFIAVLETLKRRVR